MPTTSELAAFHSAADPLYPWAINVTGNYTGTTDEIMQWAAYKWGIDVNIVRAVATIESHWQQASVGDWNSTYNEYMSFGLMQVKRNVDPSSYTGWVGTYPLSAESTAFNVDFWAGRVRQAYDGGETWLNDPCCATPGYPYSAGDIWGSVGLWYSGRWWDQGAQNYISGVQGYVQTKPWLAPGF